MRLVLDTNVTVSAALWRGAPRQVLEKAHSNHQLCFSLSMLQELERVLQYPKLAPRFSSLSFSLEEFLERLTERAIVIPDPPEEDVIKEDSTDNKFLACAATVGAELIVSGDEHLLMLGMYEDIPIVTPKEAARCL